MGLGMLGSAAAVTAPYVARSTDRGAPEPCHGVVDRALDASPVLIVVPQAEPATAGGAQLLCAHPDEPHRIASLDLIEEAVDV